MDGTVEGVGVGESLMGQMVRLEIVPDNLDVVEFGCVFWRDGFEPEISLAVLPNAQSELPFGWASPTVAIASLI